MLTALNVTNRINNGSLLLKAVWFFGMFCSHAAAAQCTKANITDSSFCEGQRAEIRIADTESRNRYRWFRDGDFYDYGYGVDGSGRHFVSPSEITGVASQEFWYSRERQEVVGPAGTLPAANGTAASPNQGSYVMTFSSETDFRLNTITIAAKVNWADPGKLWGFQVRIAEAGQAADPSQGTFSEWKTYRFTGTEFEKITIPVDLDIKAGTGYTIQVSTGSAVKGLAAADEFYWYNPASYVPTSFLNSPSEITINPVNQSIYSSARIPLIQGWDITVKCPLQKVTAIKRTTGCCSPQGTDFQLTVPLTIVKDEDLPMDIAVTGPDAEQGSYYMWFDEARNLVTDGEGTDKKSIRISKPGTYFVRIVKDAAFKNSFSCFRETSAQVQKRILFATSDKKSICLGASATLVATGATDNVNWTPGDYLTSTTGKVIKATPATPGKYTYKVSATVPVGNLVTDGDFDESTVAAPKFETKYTLIGEIPASGPNNHAAIGTKAYAAWAGGNDNFCDDTAGFYTPDRGRFLFADAASSNIIPVPADWGLNNSVWQQSNLPVSPDTDYEFRFLVTDWGVDPLTDPTKTADIQMYVNGVPLLLTPFEIKNRCKWTEVKGIWNSGNNTSARITIADLNAQNYGGEFAIDDISFGAPGTQTDTVSITVTDCFSLTGRKIGDCRGDSIIIEAKTSGLFLGWTREDGSIEGIRRPSSRSTWTKPTVPTTYVATASFQLDNLIYNGDFEEGEVGFTSSYGKNMAAGKGYYSIGKDPFVVTNGASWTFPKKDHTSGNGNMFLADGGSVKAVAVYKTSVEVETGKEYAFSAWLANIHSEFLKNNPDTGVYKTTNLAFYIDGQLNNSIKLPLDTTWSQFYATWTSNKTGRINIEIRNMETAAEGNDFALDDLVFAPLSPIKKTVKVEVPACKTCNKPQLTNIMQTKADGTKCEGEELTLNGEFTNSGKSIKNGGQYYAWYKSGTLQSEIQYHKLNPNPSGIGKISLPANAAKNFSAVTKADTGLWVLRVEDGTAGDVSCYTEDTVTVRVQPSTEIIRDLKDTAVCEGSFFVLRIEAKGSGNLHYKWEKNGVAVGTDTSILEVSAFQEADTGRYRVIVTGDCGPVSSRVTEVRLLRKPQTIEEPESVTRCMGGAAAFSVRASGTSPFTYLWRKNNSPLSGTDRRDYAIGSLRKEDQANAEGEGYDVVVSNRCGSDTSVKALLTVNEYETPGVELSISKTHACQGESIVLRAKGTGGTNRTYTFRRTSLTGPVVGTEDQQADSVTAGPINSPEETFVVEMKTDSDCLSPGPPAASNHVSSESRTVNVILPPVAEINHPVSNPYFTASRSLALEAAETGTGYALRWLKAKADQQGTIKSRTGSEKDSLTGLIETEEDGAGKGTTKIYLVVQDTGNICPADTDSVIVIKRGLTVPKAGKDSVICSINLPLTFAGNSGSIISDIENYTWRDLNSPSLPGAVTGSGISIPAGTAQGTYIFELEIENTVHGIFRDTVSITVHEASAEPQFKALATGESPGNPFVFCSTGLLLPGVPSPQPSTTALYWWDDNTSGILPLTDSTDASPLLSDISGIGSASYFYKNGVCPAKKKIFYYRKAGETTPARVTIGGGKISGEGKQYQILSDSLHLMADQTADTLCLNGTYTLQPGKIRSDEKGTWALLDGSSVSFPDLNKESIEGRAVSAGITTLVWKVNGPSPDCAPDSLVLKLVVHDVPAGGGINGNNTICEGTDTLFNLNPGVTSTLPVHYTWSGINGAFLISDPGDTLGRYRFGDGGIVTDGTIRVKPANRCGVGSVPDKKVTIKLAPRRFYGLDPANPSDTINGPGILCASSKHASFKLDNQQPATEYYQWSWNGDTIPGGNKQSHDAVSVFNKNNWDTTTSSNHTITVKLTNHCSASAKAAFEIQPLIKSKAIQFNAPVPVSVSLNSDKNGNRFCMSDDSVLFLARSHSSFPNLKGKFEFYLNDTITSSSGEELKVLPGKLKDAAVISVHFKPDSGQCVYIENTALPVKMEGFGYPDAEIKALTNPVICEGKGMIRLMVKDSVKTHKGTSYTNGNISWYRITDKAGKDTVLTGRNSFALLLDKPEESGLYYVVTEGSVCRNSKSKQLQKVKIYEQPSVSFNQNPYFVPYEEDKQQYRMPAVISGLKTDTISFAAYSPALWLRDPADPYTILVPQKEEREQEYLLTVYTGNPNDKDEGCVAEAPVKIVFYLPVSVPNAFTPNGDGVNDTWIISGLYRYPQTTVKVFNRWGASLFNDQHGFRTGWDGTHNGTSLPAGTYYYVIELKGSPDGSDRTLTGPITIIR